MSQVFLNIRIQGGTSQVLNSGKHVLLNTFFCSVNQQIDAGIDLGRQRTHNFSCIVLMCRAVFPVQSCRNIEDVIAPISPFGKMHGLATQL